MVIPCSVCPSPKLFPVWLVKTAGGLVKTSVGLSGRKVRNVSPRYLQTETKYLTKIQRYLFWRYTSCCFCVEAEHRFGSGFRFCLQGRRIWSNFYILEPLVGATVLLCVPYLCPPRITNFFVSCTVFCVKKLRYGRNLLTDLDNLGFCQVFLQILFMYPGGGDMFYRNVGNFL